VGLEGLHAVMARKPRRFICLDAAFRGNDQLKTHTVLEMKSHGIVFHTV
jgi:adenine-specific DNA-methyltransferase